jgi:hypothetical protein
MPAGGSFQSGAKASLIPWIGSVALRFVTGQPHKTASFAQSSLPASVVLMFRGLGAWRERWKNLCCSTLKRTPLQALNTGIGYRDCILQKAKVLEQGKG